MKCILVYGYVAFCMFFVVTGRCLALILFSLSQSNGSQIGTDKTARSEMIAVLCSSNNPCVASRQQDFYLWCVRFGPSE